MSKGVKSKQGDRASGFAKEILGMGILLFSVLSLLCLITGDLIFYTVGRYVRGFFLGLFGYFSFLAILAFCLLGLRLLLDRSVLNKSVKRTLSLICLIAILIASIVQTAVFYDSALSFGDNFSSAYGGGLKDFSSSTVTGAVSLLIICPLGAIISKVGCYIVFSVLIVLSSVLLFKSQIAQISFKRSDSAKKPHKEKKGNITPQSTEKKKDDDKDKFEKDKVEKDKTFDDKDGDKNKDDDFIETLSVKRPEYMGGGDFGLKTKRDYNKTPKSIDFFGGNFNSRNNKNKSDIQDRTYGEQYKKDLGRNNDYRKDLSPEANYIMTPPPLNPESIGQPPIKADNPSNRYDGRRGSAPEYDNNAIYGSTYNVNGREMQRKPVRDGGNLSGDRYESNNLRGGLFDGAPRTCDGFQNGTPNPRQDGFQNGTPDKNQNGYQNRDGYRSDVEQRLNAFRGKNLPSENDDTKGSEKPLHSDGLTRAVDEMITRNSDEPSMPNMSKIYNPAIKANGLSTDGEKADSRLRTQTAPSENEWRDAPRGSLNLTRTNVPDMTRDNYDDYDRKPSENNSPKRGDFSDRFDNGDYDDKEFYKNDVDTKVGTERTALHGTTEVGRRSDDGRSEYPKRSADDFNGSDYDGEPKKFDTAPKNNTDFSSATTNSVTFDSSVQDIDTTEEEEPDDGYMSIEDMPRNYKYVKPAIDLLKVIDIDEAKVLAERQRLMELAKLVEVNFYKRGTTVTLVNIVYGMSITRFEYSIPTETSVKCFTQNQGDIAVWLHAKGEIRIIAPIPGTSLIGIEVPNLVRSTVGLREILSSPQFRKLNQDGIYIPAGKNVMAEPVFLNLTEMPHLLIAGATGTGKSVFLNTMLVSLLYTYSPEDLRIVIVDPKQLEFVGFEGIPHLMFNKIITQAEEAAALLRAIVKEMDERYALFARARVKKISAYNASIDRRTTKKLPYIIVLIDEFADLMMKNPVAKKDMDASIMRLAQLARAAGISLVFATQRPTTDVIDGTIKNNFPARICFKTADYTNSQVVLGENGAEKLLGKGDLLYKVGGPMERAQGALVGDEEIEKVVDFVNEHNTCYYDKKMLKQILAMAKTYEQAQGGEKGGQMSMNLGEGPSPADMPPDYHKAVRLVIALQTSSKSMLQTKLGIGYNKAARIIDWMENQGFISYPMDNKQREIRIDREGYERIFKEPFEEV